MAVSLQRNVVAMTVGPTDFGDPRDRRKGQERRLTLSLDKNGYQEYRAPLEL